MRATVVRPLVLLAFPLAVLAGCAQRSATRGEAVVTPTTTRVEGVGGTISLNGVSASEANAIPLFHPIAKVWAMMPVVYDSLGLPVNQIDPQGYVIGAANQRVKRQLGKMPLSRYINCGSMQGGASADSYEVNLTLLTRLRATEAGTTALTTLDAMARPVSTRGDWVKCSSEGRLERQLAEALQKALR